MTDRKITPQERYHKTSTINVNIRLMKNTEQDIIDHLAAQPNKAGYIKSLIRADMDKEAKPKWFTVCGRKGTLADLFMGWYNANEKARENGFELNPRYVSALAALLEREGWAEEASVVRGDDN